MAKQAEECFVIMPISDPEGYEKGHFKHIYTDIISVACRSAGYEPVRADDVLETNLIHLDVLKRIIESPMAICDLSTRNPNVMFELGLRQAFDKPVVLVRESGTPDIFDIAPLRYTEYRKECIYHEVLEDQKSIADAITATKKSTENGRGINSMVKLLSLTSPAQLADFRQDESSPMMQVLMAEIGALRHEFKQSRISDSDQNTPHYLHRDSFFYKIENLEDKLLTTQLKIEMALDNSDALLELRRRMITYDEQTERLLRDVAIGAIPKEYERRLLNMKIHVDQLMSLIEDKSHFVKPDNNIK